MAKYANGTVIKSRQFVDAGLDVTFVRDEQPGRLSWLAQGEIPLIALMIFGDEKGEVRWSDETMESNIENGDCIVLFEPNVG